jgi:hypothetical protein
MNGSKDIDVTSVNAVGPVTGLARFEVKFDAYSPIQSKSLYANGRMQVRVLVFAVGKDANENEVPLPYYPTLLTVKLIQYRDGKPLRGVWSASTIENEYTHELSAGSQSLMAEARQSQSNIRPLEFWVSSNRAESMDIAAEITLNGKVFRCNDTVNPDGSKFGVGVTLNALPPVTYAATQFSWQPQSVGGGLDGDRIWRYQLGLTSGARQVKLLTWRSGQYAPHWPPVEFCNSGELKSVAGNKSFVGVFPAANANRVEVKLPGGLTHHYYIPVNQTQGEFSVVLGQSSKYYDNARIRHEPYHFSVIDEFGNEHRLSIGIDLSKAGFTLQRG